MTLRIAPVTAVVPCYRCRDTVERAVRSILKQTRPVSEILLIEDGSGDGTLQYLQAMVAKLGDPRIHLIALSENGGPGVARNAGWEQASQPWLAFLDADDAWHPRKIELQFGWVEGHAGVEFVAHDTAPWSESARALPEIVPDGVLVSPRHLLFRNVIPTRSVILRKGLPLRFPPKRNSEDYMLWLELAFGGTTCWKLPIALVFSFRPEFSRGGASGALWEHEREELHCYRVLFRSGRIGAPTAMAASTFSLLKFLRRLAVVASR
jgi:glycosyltransferase involved in cell wall biosynthesis